MSAREWSDEEALVAVREVLVYGEFPILGRAILTLRAERDDLRAKVELDEDALRALLVRAARIAGSELGPALAPGVGVIFDPQAIADRILKEGRSCGRSL